MTGNEIYKQACSLLEYEAEETEAAKTLALSCINGILCDMGICDAVGSLDEEVKLNPTNSFIAVFGVAMLLAHVRLDTLRGRLMAEVYYPKRAQVKSEILRCRESFPTPSA